MMQHKSKLGLNQVLTQNKSGLYQVWTKCFPWLKAVTIVCCVAGCLVSPCTTPTCPTWVVWPGSGCWGAPGVSPSSGTFSLPSRSTLPATSPDKSLPHKQYDQAADTQQLVHEGWLTHKYTQRLLRKIPDRVVPWCYSSKQSQSIHLQLVQD